MSELMEKGKPDDVVSPMAKAKSNHGFVRRKPPRRAVDSTTWKLTFNNDSYANRSATLLQALHPLDPLNPRQRSKLRKRR